MTTQPFPSHMLPAITQYMAVFHPHAMKRLIEIEKSKIRFVHYTSAEVTLEPLKNPQLWMRLTSGMTDYSEISHGLNCLSKAWTAKEGQQLKAFLDEQFSGIVKEIEASSNSIVNTLRSETFIACLSEYAGEGREEEDRYGRLSMWREYCEGVGCALVIKQDPFWAAADSLGVFTSPVAYLDDDEFAKELGLIATSIQADVAYLNAIGRDATKRAVFNAITVAAACTKHPGFEEELEWRIIGSNAFLTPPQIDRTTKVIRGVPQEILLLPLKDNPAKGIKGFEIPDFLDRIIIGPTEHPVATLQRPPEGDGSSRYCRACEEVVHLGYSAAAAALATAALK
jgi:hypothetical protein